MIPRNRLLYLFQKTDDRSMSEPALKLHSNTSEILKSGKKFFSFFPMSILICSSALVLSLSYYWFIYLDKYITTDDAYIEADFYPVSTKVAGAVQEVYAREGQSVKKGELLLLIDDSDFVFEKNFKHLKVEKAELDFKRAKTLHATKAISDFDYENAEASLKAAEVDLQGTDIKIKYTKILASANGIVAKRSVQVGQVIQPGQSLFILVDDQDHWVRANFKETQVRNLKIGQPVSIKVDGYPHDSLNGLVEAIFPSSGAKLSLLPPENSTGNFTRIVQRIPVKISISKNSKSNFILKPGMSVEVSVDSTVANEPRIN